MGRKARKVQKPDLRKVPGEVVGHINAKSSVRCEACGRMPQWGSHLNCKQQGES